MKLCSRCKTECPIELFAKGRNNDGLHPWCKNCRSEYIREYRKTNPPKPASPEQQRAAQLRINYGLTVEGYDELLASQGGRCATCPAVPQPGAKKFHVDHDHSCCPGVKTCGKCIRGILCHKCNMALGLVGDSPGQLRVMANYLEMRSL